MDLRPITIDHLREIYPKSFVRDFPSDELMPFARMEALTQAGIQKAYGLYDGGRLMAYGVFILAPGSPAALLNYFAVEPEFRGRGVGTRALRQLCGAGDLDVDYILFEVETPRSAKGPEELAVRQRRIRFYLRCGARRTILDSRLFGVDYHIMLLPHGDKLENVPEDRALARQLEMLYRVVVPGEEQLQVLAREAFPEGELPGRVRFEDVCQVSLAPGEQGRFSRELGRALSFLTRSRKKFMGEHLREYDLTGGMYMILLHVDRHPGTSQDSIAGHMYMDKCTVARRTKKLEALGYLYRETDQNDRRQNKLFLTLKGVELVPVIREYLSQWGDEATGKLTEDEKRTLLRLLTKMTGQSR